MQFIFLILFIAVYKNVADVFDALNQKLSWVSSADVGSATPSYRLWASISQGLLNRWTSQLDLGCTTGGLERVVSVHNST